MRLVLKNCQVFFTFKDEFLGLGNLRQLIANENKLGIVEVLQIVFHQNRLVIIVFYNTNEMTIILHGLDDLNIMLIITYNKFLLPHELSSIKILK